VGGGRREAWDVSRCVSVFNSINPTDLLEDGRAVFCELNLSVQVHQDRIGSDSRLGQEEKRREAEGERERRQR
jgi:hypothetical protein